MENTLLIAILGSAGFTAFVGIVGNIIMWKLNRTATKEDKKDVREIEIKELRKTVSDLKTAVDTLQKESKKTIDLVNEQINIQCESSQALMRNAILRIYYKYLPWKALPVYERENFAKLTDIYIDRLHGNSFVKDIKPEIDSWDTIKDLEYFNESNIVGQ